MISVSSPVFLRSGDFAGKLTPGGTVPTRTSRPDEIGLWRLANRKLWIDTEAGEVYRADGTTRAERPTPEAYGVVYLGRIAGRIRWARAHRLVWIARHGVIPGMYEINHRNSMRWDNRIANLDMVTHAANCLHAHQHDYPHIAGVAFSGPDDRPEFTPYASAENRRLA